MKLHRYKPLILQLGILLFIVAAFFYVLEQQKKFITIDFSKHYAGNRTIEISGFEQGEPWRGNFTYDSERVLEGKSSITLSSWYGIKNSLSSNNTILLKEGYSKGYIRVFIPNSSQLDAIESFTLGLSNATNTKNVDLLPGLLKGWNTVSVVIPSWKKIDSITFNIISKGDKIAEVNLDRFWIENTSQYQAELFTTPHQSLSLRTIGERTYLYSTSPTLSEYIFSSPSTIRKGVVTIGLIPEYTNTIILSLNSTEISIGGKDQSECQLKSDIDSTVITQLKKHSGKNDLYVFLKAEVVNNRVTYSISNNGVDFELCGAIQGSSKKPIKLSLQGSYLIDSFALEY